MNRTLSSGSLHPHHLALGPVSRSDLGNYILSRGIMSYCPNNYTRTLSGKGGCIDTRTVSLSTFTPLSENVLIGS